MNGVIGWYAGQRVLAVQPFVHLPNSGHFVRPYREIAPFPPWTSAICQSPVRVDEAADLLDVLGISGGIAWPNAVNMRSHAGRPARRAGAAMPCGYSLESQRARIGIRISAWINRDIKRESVRATVVNPGSTMRSTAVPSAFVVFADNLT